MPSPPSSVVSVTTCVFVIDKTSLPSSRSMSNAPNVESEDRYIVAIPAGRDGCLCLNSRIDHVHIVAPWPNLTSSELLNVEAIKLTVSRPSAGVDLRQAIDRQIAGRDVIVSASHFDLHAPCNIDNRYWQVGDAVHLGAVPPALMPVTITSLGFAPAVIVIPLLKLSPLITSVPA